MKPLLWPLLGAVRFILALLVAGLHLSRFAPHSALLPVFDDMSAFIAVLGFLMISGYSIAASHARQPGGFYRRRLLRIVPLYVLAIAAGVACTAFFGGAVTAPDGAVFVTPPKGETIGNLFFLQGFTTASIANNAVVWSLSVEVFYYLLTPWLARRSSRVLLVLAGISLVLFIVGANLHLPNFALLKHGAAAALLGWAWLAGFMAFRQADPLRAAMAVLGVSVVALGSYAGALTLHPLFPLLLVCAGLAFSGQLRGPGWLAGLCDRLGDASYPLYLFHLPLYIAWCGLGVRLPAIGLLAAAVLAAVVLDRLYDQPVKKLVLHLSRSAKNWAARRMLTPPSA